jgi:hypothetical protein
VHPRRPRTPHHRHSKISITMEIYTETTSEATRDALHKLGDRLA